MWESRGAVLPVRTGGGKTLIAAASIAIMRPKRPLLVVPASMLVDAEETWRRLHQHWRIPTFEDVSVLSYEKISSPGSGAKTLPDGQQIYPDIIQRLRPDMVVLDEAHRFGDVSAAGTRRVGRYLEGHPETIVVAMSGTLIRRSLSDAAHIMYWALRDRSPLPREWKELQAWSDATDPRPSKGKRTDPGALLSHMPPGLRTAYETADFSEDARGAVCELIGQRILETAGVVGSADGPLQIPADLKPYYVQNEDEAIEQEYVRLLEGDEENDRPAWALADGTLLADAQSLARPLNTLSFGFYQIQDPAPPEEYKQASSAWASAVRNTIKYLPGLNLDSEFMVRDAVERGILPEHAETLAAWRQAKLDYSAATGLREPPSKPVWISDEVVEEVRRFLKDGPAYVWVSWRALGERLSKDLGLPYFSGGKTDASGRHVTRLKNGESAVLSMAAVGTGTDGLQAKGISRQLWLCAPQEQALARVHRPGFTGEKVENFVYCGSGSCLARFWRQVGLAQNFAQRLSGSASKLCYFENEMPERLPEEGRRWSTVVGSVDSSDGDA
jgi:hypothetical protein